MRPFSSSAQALLGLVCGALWLVPAASAQADALAQQPLREGLELRRAHKDQQALELFRHAYVDAPTPNLRAQIALAEQALGQWVDAEHDLFAALSEPDPWVQAHRTTLEQALKVIQAHLGSLEVLTNHAGVEVKLDGERLGILPAEAWRVSVGPHRLVLRLADRELERELTLSRGERLIYRVEWPAAEPPPTKEDTPDVAPSAPSPTPAANARQQPLPTAADSRRSATLGYVFAGLAVVTLAEGVAASLLRLHYAEQYNGAGCYPERSKQCAPYREIANTFGTIALASYSLAGAAGLGAAAWFTWPAKSAGTPAGSLGLALTGQF